MINELFTIYDKVAQEAGPIFQAKNLYVAMRYVKDMIKDNNINIPNDIDYLKYKYNKVNYI